MIFPDSPPSLPDQGEMILVHRVRPQAVDVLAGVTLDLPLPAMRIRAHLRRDPVGIAHMLHNELIVSRPEQRAAPPVSLGNTSAYGSIPVADVPKSKGAGRLGLIFGVGFFRG
ncbi:hypothetical protein AB0C10_29540 [Microbispora amethystogenes]|uniref:hypothetical protein n=1 Tax=Microbispora amethystogenes TaxID=1427754 RepID=UPI0033DD43A1